MLGSPCLSTHQVLENNTKNQDHYIKYPQAPYNMDGEVDQMNPHDVPQL